MVCSDPKWRDIGKELKKDASDGISKQAYVGFLFGVEFELLILSDQVF